MARANITKLQGSLLHACATMEFTLIDFMFEESELNLAPPLLLFVTAPSDYVLLIDEELEDEEGLID
jgi:hypothetical protein